MDESTKETVTITCITTHEVDPNEFDLRVTDPKRIQEELIRAADPCGSIQVVADGVEEELLAYREQIQQARTQDTENE